MREWESDKVFDNLRKLTIEEANSLEGKLTYKETTETLGKMNNIEAKEMFESDELTYYIINNGVTPYHIDNNVDEFNLIKAHIHNKAESVPEQRWESHAENWAFDKWNWVFRMKQMTRLEHHKSITPTQQW